MTNLQTSPKKNPYNGLLLIDKQILYTSHDMVDIARRKLQMKRIGHAGTLDPMATGLIILMLGEATRSFDALSGNDKTYEGIMTFGMTTKTQDCEGEITTKTNWDGIDEAAVLESFKKFTGIIEQRIPQYSAAKVKGRKGYEMARKGIVMEMPTKEVEVKSLELLQYDAPNAYFKATVSKGTYLRVLASDIGADLGAGGTLSSLRRTHSGGYNVQDALTLSDFNRIPLEEISNRLIATTRKIA